MLYIKMRKSLFILAGLFFLMIPLVMAIDIASYIPEDSVYDLKVSCDVDGAICPSTMKCNLTMYYTNSSFLINNKQMTNLLNGYYNYTLSSTQTSIKGVYNTLVYCSDGSRNASSNFYSEINPTGIPSTDQRSNAIDRSVYIVFVLGIIFFLAYIFVQSSISMKYTFLIISIIFILIGLNIMFVSLQDEIVNPKIETFFDNFIAISYYIYWFAAGMLGLLWGFTFLNTYFYKKNMQEAQKFGYD